MEYYIVVKNKKDLYKLMHTNFQEILNRKSKVQKTIFRCQNFHNKEDKIRKYECFLIITKKKTQDEQNAPEQ